MLVVPSLIFFNLCRCGEGEAKAAAVFKILQIDDTFAHSELLYLKADLFDTTRLNIIANQLTGETQISSSSEN